MTYKKLIIMLLMMLLMFLSMFAQEEKKEKNKLPPYQDEEARYRIDVNYYLLDVLAFNEDGSHMMDLDIDDFELFINGERVQIASLDKYNYIDSNYLKKFSTESDSRMRQSLIDQVEEYIIGDDGFEKDISMKTAASLSDIKPLRTFVVVFANLPLMPRRWFILRDGLIDYIENKMGEGVQIAVYSMGLSKLSVIQPFTTNRKKVINVIDTYLSSRWGYDKKEEYNDGTQRHFDLDEKDYDFFIMADAPLPEVDHSNSSWIISGFDRMIIQKDTVYALFKQFDMLINKIKDIPGRKNILLFSEGFPYISASPSEFMEMRKRKRQIVNRFNLHNISIYTFDMFTPRDLYAADIRAGFLSELSADTNGAFFRFLGNSIEKITDRLIATDFYTANYYIIGFYMQGIDLSEKADVEIKVNREGAVLYYARSLKDTIDLTFPERYLKEMAINRKLFEEKKYSDLSLKTGITYMPAEDNEVWVTFSTKLPIKELVIPDSDSANKDKKEIKLDDLEAQLMLEINPSDDNNVYYVMKKIEYDTDQAATTITYNYRTKLKPGKYSVRMLLHSKTNNKTASSDIEINIPNLRFKDDFISLVIANNEKNNIVIENNLHDILKKPFNPATLPFYSTGTKISPSTFPVLSHNQTIDCYIFSKGNKTEIIQLKILSAENTNPIIIDISMLNESAWGSEFNIKHIQAKLPDLKPGIYKLIAEYLDKKISSDPVEFIIE